MNPADKFAAPLANRTVALGITNIRVIRRIRRFRDYLEASLTGLHDGVIEGVISSIALLAWCVFKPKQAPDPERIRKFSQWSGLFGEDKRSPKDKEVDLMLREYGFSHFDEVDDFLLDGLKAGSFDIAALDFALKEADRCLRKNDVQIAIRRPWVIFRESVDDNVGEFCTALIEAIETHGEEMSPVDASSALSFLRELGKVDEADRLLTTYIEAQSEKPREFFGPTRSAFPQSIDPGIEAAFKARLSEMTPERNPAEVLLSIDKSSGWNPSDVRFLASVPVETYREILKRLKGSDLHGVITTALQFSQFGGVGSSEMTISERMEEAVRSVANENKLNEMRLKDYIRNKETKSGGTPDLSAAGHDVEARD